MRRILREPLLHFAVAGGLLFAVHASMAPPDPDPDPVRIGARELHWLQQSWTRQWRRPPSPEETHGLVVEFLKEELLSRDARNLGLDRDDTIVRRRLAQKVEFLIQDTARTREPSEDDLLRFYEDHADRFVAPARVSFEQVVFSNTRRADSEADARSALDLLRSERGDRPAAVEGDPSLLPSTVEDLDATAIANQFGDAFAHAVLGSPEGAWSGPVASPFGSHLIRVTRRTASLQRGFDEARAQVAIAWRDAREADTAANYFNGLLQRYPVIVDDETAALVAGIDGARLLEASRGTGDEEASR